jgi:Fe-S-cluster containining protein
VKPKDERRALKNLYDLIDRMPKFECIPGCTDCCGPVPASREEIRKASKLANVPERLETLVETDTLGWCATCDYARPGHGCAIYEDRPFLCRLFGYSEAPQLTCVHGRGSTKKLTIQQTAALTDRYVKIINAVPERKAAQEKINAIMKEKWRTDHL